MIEVKVIGQMDNTIDNTFESANRVYDVDGLSPTVNTCGGGGLQPKVIVASRGRNPQNPSDRTAGNHVEQRLEPNSEGICNTLTSVQKDNLVLEPQLKIIDIPQTVSVRKHKVDVEKLKKTLREHKKIANKEIAHKLDRPITMVEHWFRKDSSFSIPDADIWHQLKELLGISTDEFDLQVTEFIEQDGVFEKANRCYMTDGISPTLTSASADEKILEPTVKIKQATQQGYAECKLGGVADLSYPTSKTRRGRVQDGGDTCPTLTASETGICRIETPYRIRKLTPLECWRLMDFTDEDFYKAKFIFENEESIEELTRDKFYKILYSDLSESKKLFHIEQLKIKTRERMSNTQLYKQAGNSIVKAVLMAIFKQML